MSQQIPVARWIIFKGEAAFTQNIRGNPNPLKPCFDEHFFFDLSEHDWVEGEANGGTIAWTAPHIVTLTTGSVNDDVNELSHAMTMTCNKNFFIQFRAHTDSIAATGINIGVVDAVQATNDEICFEITGTALVNARVSNGAAFVYDTDGSTNIWYACATKGDAEGDPAAFTGATYGATTAPVASTYAYFGIKGEETTGDVTFYYNNEPVGHQAAALTASTALVPYVSNITRTTGAKVVTVDRITVWQDED